MERSEMAPIPPDTRAARRIDTPPLCLIAFAVITFMFSLLNAGAVPQAVVPIIIATGLIFGGITQLTAALIQIGSGDTLNGALFGAGNYGDYAALVRVGGVTGIILAAQALYLAAAGICGSAYGRTVLPLGPTSRSWSSVTRRPGPPEPTVSTRRLKPGA